MSFATFVQGVSPFGPIFGKELRTTARRKRTYFLRVIYLAILLVVLLGAFLITSNNGRYGGVAAQNQQRSQLSQIFFAFFAIFSVMMMGLVGPVLTSTAISSERLHKTLPVLLMTPITAWQIVSGKLFSRLLVLLTLIGLGLPVLALVRLLGGVELGQMLGVVALAVVAAVSSAAIGLFFSTLLNRAYAVILLSFAAMLFLYLFVPFVIALSWRFIAHHSPGMGAAQLIWAINPYWLVFPAAIPDMLGRLRISLPWGWCIGSHLGLSAFLLMCSALVLRRRARIEGEAVGGTLAPAVSVAATPVPAPVPLTASASDTPLIAPAPPALPTAYADPVRRRRKDRAARHVADNPILWRELRRPLFARRWQRITAVAICLLMLGVVYSLLWGNDLLADADSQAVWASIFNFLISGIVLVISATAIAQEKESDTWTLLLATPISGRTIVWGKALGIARRLLWPTLLAAAHLLIFAFCRVITFSGALLAIWVIVSFNTVWIATGVYFSLRFNKVTLAVIANLMLAIAAYLFVWGALGLSTTLNFNRGVYMSPATIDPQWIAFAVTAVFATVAAAWVLTAFFAFRRPRGALGQLMIVSLLLFVAGAVFAAKIRWISVGRLDEQVGWYLPYYYLAQIRRDVAELRLPDGQDIVGSLWTLFVVFVLGGIHLAIAAFVLSMTAWKFSALVGRAPQAHSLSSVAG